MKLGLVIVSHRRPDILKKVLMNLTSKHPVPDEIVLSAVDPSDVSGITGTIAGLRTIFGSPGISCQRNRGISCLIDTMDVIAFIDDDFIVGDDYFLNMRTIFEQDDSIVGVCGKVIADGASSAGLTFEEGVRLIEEHRRQRNEEPNTRDIIGTYGCNMAFRSASIRSLRFDERLALYAWQEDLDFCGALRRSGRIVGTNFVWGVHLGTKLGKGSELRLGYSQVVNPAYIVRKGNLPLTYALHLIAKNFLANLVKSIRPESYVDRRGRLRGNLIGLFHIMTGRLTPEYILQMK